MDDIKIEDIFMLFAILLGLAAIAWAFAAVMNKKREDNNASYPVQRGHATLVDKPQAPSNGIVVISRIWVLFDLDDGRRVRLMVSGNQFPYVVGDKGELTWQGDALLGFHRDGDAQSTNATGISAPAPTAFDQAKIPTWKRVEMEQKMSDH